MSGHSDIQAQQPSDAVGRLAAPSCRPRRAALTPFVAGLVVDPLVAHRGLPAPRLGEGDEGSQRDDGGLATEEAKPELKRPPLFKVVLLNDDYTPMEFVVEVLEVFFKMNREQATQVMLTVHTQGRGVCGIYTRDIAETKAAQVNQYARDHQHPLLCEIEASGG